MKKHSVLLLASVCLSLLISGCSSTNRAYYDTLKLAFAAGDGPRLSADQVRQSQADLLQVTRGERAPVILALAFIENNTNKWVSADSSLLYIQQGVVTQTQGLAQDVLYTSNTRRHPLTQPGALAFSWTRQLDIDGVGYGIEVTSEWHQAGTDTVQIFDQAFATRKVEEQVVFSKTTPYLEAGLSWTNTYWFSQASSELVQASVQVTPYADRIHMVYLSRAARQLAAQEQAN